jgi:hypothetical protein
VAEVRLDGRGAEEQLLADRRRGLARRDQVQDLALAIGQHGTVAVDLERVDLAEQAGLQHGVEHALAARDGGDGIADRVAVGVLGPVAGRSGSDRRVDQSALRGRRQHEHARRRALAHQRLDDVEAAQAGMRMSSTATSGASRRISSSAARPSPSSPTSSSSGRAPTARASPSRNSGWSSAMRTVARMRCPAMVSFTRRGSSGL